MRILIAIPIILLLLAGCHQQDAEKSKHSSAMPLAIDDSTASELTKPANRKFIRSAEVKFRVEDLHKTSQAIEEMVKGEKGFLIYTNFSNTVDNTSVVSVSRDSSLETVYYTIGNTITFRVPTVRFDTVLRQVEALADFLDYRIVKADDVSFQMLSNDLAVKRSVSGNKKNNREQADNAAVSNLYLNDQLSYSTVSLLISQRQSLKRTMIANAANIKAYTPGFGTKMIDALLEGWSRVEELALFIIRFWAIIGLVLGLYFFYRRYGHRLRTPLKKKS